MKNKQRKVLSLSLFSVLALTSCGSSIPGDWNSSISYEFAGQTAYNALKNEKRVGVYNYYESYMPASFNTAVTMQSEDSRHIANIVDGLVDVSRTGKIIPALSVGEPVWSETKDEVTYTIRDQVPWVLNNGNGSDIYKSKAGVEQFVSAQDWVTSAKIALNFENASESYYLISLFVDGADEYFTYTLLDFRMRNGYGIITEAKLAEFAADAESKDEAVKKAYETCLKNVGAQASPGGSCAKYADVTLFTTEYIAKALNTDVATLPKIADFSRVGIIANGNKLTYKLTAPSPFFPTVLTYTPYFPINAAFIDDIGIEKFGSDRKYILSNGAYVMSKFNMGTSKSIEFTKNENYWDKNNVRLQRVNAKAIPKSTSSSTARQGYEKGITDGFTVNSVDDAGWKKYVTGPDGKGTVDNPYHKDARAVEGLGDGSTFAFFINMNRNPDKNGGGVNKTIMSSHAAYNVDANNDGLNDTLVNTNKALSVLPSLRELVFKGLDQEIYLNSEGKTNDERVSQVVNTWVPANFINYDGWSEADKTEGIMGKDFVDFTKKAYVDKFYNSQYTEENFEKADAALSHGSLSKGDKSLNLDVINRKASEVNGWDWTLTDKGKLDLASLKSKVNEEVKAWNAAHATDQISLPVVVEYIGLTYNAESDVNDAEFINSSNARVAGCWIGGDALEASIGRPKEAKICTSKEEGDAVVRYVKNNKSNVPDATTYSQLSQSSASTLIISGWGPDYSDPLTFAQTTVFGGDLHSNFGLNTSNPYAAQLKQQWEKYDTLVDEAAAITSDDKARYNKFAEAEIELLFELNIVKPIKERGLGKMVSISKTVPFRISSAVYGVSSFKYKNIEVLDRALTKAEYLALKEERYVENA